MPTLPLEPPTTPRPVRLVSLLASNADPFYARLAAYLSARTGLDLHLPNIPDWRERGRRLEAGGAEGGFLCGLLYAAHHPDLEAVAAPVGLSPRYGNRPVYFSDVIVPASSPFTSLDDLRGARWAYNDRGSFSGYALLLDHLLERGEGAGYLGQWRESGGHLASLDLVLSGEVDAAALDSTVLETALSQRPELAGQLRGVATLGPNPAPPLVLRRNLEPAVRAALLEALLGMHMEIEGRAVLHSGLVSRFVPVAPDIYAPLLETARRAQGFPLPERGRTDHA